MDYRTILMINPLSSPDRAHTPRYVITLLGMWILPGVKGLVIISLFTILIVIEKKDYFSKIEYIK